MNPLPAATTDTLSPKLPDTLAQRVIACTACHGKEGKATPDGYYPRIAGKPEEYLYNQLLNFRDGRRKNAIMHYVTQRLSDSYLHEIAQYFSNEHPPYPAPQTLNIPQSVLERGRTLVRSGDPSKHIPACVSCHGQSLTGVLPSTPGLLGLSRNYLGAQLSAWSSGLRHTIEPDCMSRINTLLSGDDINAVTAWLAIQPIPEYPQPSPKLPAPLPLPCGSVPHSIR